MAISNDAAQKWASAAENRALLARRRASKAKGRVRSAARNGAVWKILRFFENRTPAAWGALWYLLLSAIGVTYSWAFYSRFEGIHIFDFFGTSDFLLSAFQNVKMLVIGISATLIGIGILIYRAYDSIVYGAYKSDPKEKKARIHREAVISLSIALTLIVIPLYHYFCYFSVPLSRISTDILARLLPLPFLLPFSSLLPPLLFLTYRFFKRVQNPGDDRQQDQTNWEVGILLFLLLAEATIILPFLHGRSDSGDALKDRNRRVQIALRQDSSQPGTRLPKPDRTLFLGTTSSFHFFYECNDPLGPGTDSKCENAGTDSKREKGRPFIVPTANIASLEFYQDPVTCAASATPKANIACPESDPEGGSDAPRVGLSHVIEAITKLNTTISKLKFNAIFQMESGNVILDATDVVKAVAALNQTIAEFEQLIVSDPAQSAQTIRALTTLNKTISEFQPSVDPVRIVDAMKKNTRKIITAIEGIYIPPEVQNHCGLGWERVAIIGPFCEGRHDKMEGDKECKKENAKKFPPELVTLDQLIGNHRPLFEAGTLQQLMLIGRVDITQLDENQREYYGSNNGLAQSRAKWVLDKLVKKLGLTDSKKEAALRERTILLSAGPLHVGRSALKTDGAKNPEKEQWVSEIDRAKDRSVEVWACGGAKT